MKILLCLLLTACSIAADAADGPTASVQTAAATMQTLHRRLTVYGEIQPDPAAVQGINAAYAGQVARINVRPGQRVAAGEALLELETDPSARLAFQQAEAQLAYAEGELQRTRELFAGQLATRSQLAAAEQARQQAADALAAQRKLGTNRKSGLIRAPFAGIVSSLAAHPGDRVSAGVNLLNLAAADHLVAVLGVEPSDAPGIPPQAPVELASVFDPSSGAMLSVDSVQGMVNPDTRLVDAIVTLRSDLAASFLPGQRVRAVIRVAEVRSLAVPQAALLNDGDDYLFVIRNGSAHRVTVQRGLEWQGQVAVSAAALSDGDRVVVAGNAALSDGMPVREQQP